MRTSGPRVLALAAAIVGLTVTYLPAQSQPAQLVVTSPAFKDGEAIPKNYTGYQWAKNMSPPLSWTDAPPSTREFAVILENTDGLSMRSPGRSYAQWVVYKIPGTATGLPENIAPGAIASGPLAGTIQGRNDGPSPSVSKVNPPRDTAEYPLPGSKVDQLSFRAGPPSAGETMPVVPARTPPVQYSPPVKNRYDGPAENAKTRLQHFVFHVYAIDASLALKDDLSAGELLDAIHGHIVAEGTLNTISRR